VAITASEFSLTSDTADGVVGTPITFTVTPNGLFHGTFNLSDGGKGGSFSPSSIVFNSGDWPENTDHTLPDGLTFTYTPRSAGEITITASDADLAASGLGSREIVLTVVDDGSGGGIEPEDPDVPDTGLGWFGTGIVQATLIAGAVIAVAGGAWFLTVRKMRKNEFIR
jgi:hypothetical protein